MENGVIHALHTEVQILTQKNSGIFFFFSWLSKILILISSRLTKIMNCLIYLSVFALALTVLLDLAMVLSAYWSGARLSMVGMIVAHATYLLLWGLRRWVKERGGLVGRHGVAGFLDERAARAHHAAMEALDRLGREARFERAARDQHRRAAEEPHHPAARDETTSDCDGDVHRRRPGRPR